MKRHKKKKRSKKKTAKMKTNKGGRPSKYKPEYAKRLIKFFDVEPFEEVRVPIYDESGKTHKSGKKKGEQVVTHYEVKRNPNRLPTLQRFAKKIGVGISTLYDWLNKDHTSFKPKFSDAFARARDLRKNFLIENGLTGTHQHSYAKFVAVNLTDMRDTSEKDLNVGGQEGNPVNILVFDGTDSKRKVHKRSSSGTKKRAKRV